MNNKTLLNPVINLLSNDYREIVYQILDYIPEYIWNSPSSFSKKYHPKDEHLTNGLVIHTLRVCVIALELCRAYNLSINERDILLSAAILHDVLRSGFDGREAYHSESGNLSTDPLHPFYVRQFIRTLRKRKLLQQKIGWGISIDKFSNDVCPVIESHSGRWGVPELWNVVLNDRPNNLNTLMHLADFIASRQSVGISYTDFEKIDWEIYQN